MLVRVYVMLKPDLADPQGEAIKSALHKLDFQEVEKVRIGKCIEIKLNLGDKVPRQKLPSIIKSMCDKLLANLVIEDYTYDILKSAD